MGLCSFTKMEERESRESWRVVGASAKKGSLGRAQLAREEREREGMWGNSRIPAIP